jgi:coenzyme F420-reducing hydrogenase beta subunit
MTSSSCSTSQPSTPHEADKIFRKTAAQAPEGTVSIKTTDGNEVEVPRSEINRVNEESCPTCDKGFYCNIETKKCERQD